MSFATRSVAALLILITASQAQAQAQAQAQDRSQPPQRAKQPPIPSRSTPAPARETIKLADRSVRNTATTTYDNARSNPKIITSKPEPEPEPAPAPEPEPEPVADPYGFAAHLNAYRASAGLPPVWYDPNLSSWASHNNAAQARRGLGHFVNPNCVQNCAWNIGDAATAAHTWMNSAGHRENMLSPTISRFGIAYGPGPYWTMNAQ